MTRAGPLFAALSASLLGIMAWLSWTVLTPQTGGLAPFDTRVLGYTLADAQDYLIHLGDAGRAVYLVEMRLLDTAFPMAFACLMGWLAMQLAEWVHPWSRLMLVLPAAGYALMDLCENALVANLLRAGAEGIDGDMVSLASEFTVTKWVLLFITWALLAVLWTQRRRTVQE